MYKRKEKNVCCRAQKKLGKALIAECKKGTRQRRICQVPGVMH